MRFLKVITGLAFAGLVASSAQLHASTSTVPASCSWSVVSTNSSYSAYVRNEACKDGTTTVATRTYQYASNISTPCTITGVYSPYNWAGGTCDNPSFTKTVTIVDPVTTCGPNAGKVWGTYRLGLSNYTVPTSQINAFCGSCGYTTTQISTDQGGATYQATCKI